MPRQHYRCDNCGDEFESVEGYHDKPKRKCKVCKKLKLYRVLYAPYAAVRLATSEIKTIGHLGRRRAEKAGKYEYQSKTQDLEAKRAAAPWWRPGTTRVDTSLANMDATQREAFITKGYKPAKKERRKKEKKK